MIKRLQVENFKCFSDLTTIPLSQITICTGMNSVGKSTLIQALLLLRQTYEILNNDDNLSKKNKILLNTGAIKLGSVDQIMLTKKDLFLSADSFWVKYASGKDKLSLELKYTEDIKKLSDFHGFITSPNFYYLNAERLGPRNYQEMLSHNNLHCGFHGEYTFDVIQKNPLEDVRQLRRFLIDSDKKVAELEKQIEYWMGYIVNGVEVKFNSDYSTQLAQMKVRQAALDTQFNSPYNFGFGISYVLPIITTGLIAQPNSIVIVENPEAHLHPAGQSRIGEFLAQMSCDKLQIIIETHSEHVINGIRKYALRNGMQSEDLCINYFNINKETNKHEVNRLNLNERMDILSWAEGFFDQESIDLKDLRELRRKFK